MPKLLHLLSLHTKLNIFDGQQNPFAVTLREDVIGSRRIRLLETAWLCDSWVHPGVTLSLLAADWEGR